jgi:hypothetical protein
MPCARMSRLVKEPDAERVALNRWQFDDEHGERFDVLVANDRARREKAYELAARVYARHDYVEQQRRWYCSDFDFDPATFVVLVEDGCGAAAATASLVFDSEAGLPCDEAYHDRLIGPRSGSRRFAEVVRLAVDARFSHSRALLTALFDCVSIYARRAADQDDLIIEVNPRHQAF